MQRSKVENYVHFVGATYRRAGWITPEIERDLYRCIADEVICHKCEVLALNGMTDHIHLLARVHATISLADLMQAVKGTSSTFARDNFPRT